MLYFIFVSLIFLSFTMYGFTGSLVPSVWTEICDVNKIDISALGMITFLCIISSGVANVVAYDIRKKIGHNFSMVMSLVLFIISMIIFSNAHSIFAFSISMVILGFGNGILDAAANNFIIRYMEARHVAFLHASWGIGSTIGPIYMAMMLANMNTYSLPFIFVAIFLFIVCIIFVIVKMRKKLEPYEVREKFSFSAEEKNSKVSVIDTFKIKNAWILVACFTCCYTINYLLNSWTATFFVVRRGISVAEGAFSATCFFAALTITRVVVGIFAHKLKTRTIIMSSLIILFVALSFLFINSSNIAIIYTNSMLIGVGMAPLVPYINYNTKELFGEINVPIILATSGTVSLVVTSIISVLLSPIIKIGSIAVLQYIYIFLAILAILSYVILQKRMKK